MTVLCYEPAMALCRLVPVKDGWAESGLDEFAPQKMVAGECQVAGWFNQEPSLVPVLYEGLPADLAAGEIEYEWDNHAEMGAGGYRWTFKGHNIEDMTEEQG
jgi:hypothetical protein